MKSLLIDIGATRIKYSVFCKNTNSFLSQINSIPFPKPKEQKNGNNETDIKKIESIFNKIIYNSLDNFEISNVLICSQMHSFVLRNSKKELITDFISWKDERAFEKYHPSSKNNFFDDFSEKIYDFQNITGIKTRSGIPVITIYSMSFDKNFPQEIEVLNLSEYLIENLTGSCLGSHKSLSQGLGFYDINTNLIDNKIKNLFTSNVVFKKSYDDVVSVSEWNYNDREIKFFAPLGDMQCATYGLNVSLEENILINLGTGSQIITSHLSNDSHFLEKRSFFAKNLLNVLTHYPCGRAIEIYINLINKKSDINYWNEINKLNINTILSSKEINLAVFRSAEGYKNINTSDFEGKNYDFNIELLNGLVKRLITQYRTGIDEIKKYKKINKILLTGGVAHKLPFLEELFEKFYSIDTNKLYSEDETIIGMSNIIMKN